MIQQIVDTSTAELEEIRQTEGFVKETRNLLIRHAGQALRFDGDPETRKLINIARDSARAVEPGLIRSCLLLKVCAVFEAFVKSAIEFHLDRFEAVDVIVPDILVGTNISYSGRLLANYDKGDKSRDFNHQDLIKNLYAFVDGEPGGAVNKSAITGFLGSCTYSSVDDLFRKVGISNMWDEIARSSEVRRAVKSRASRETRKLIHQTLDRYVAIRNAHAHGEHGREEVSEQQLLEAVAFYSALISAIGQLVENFPLAIKDRGGLVHEGS